MEVNTSEVCYSRQCANYGIPDVKDHYPLLATGYHLPVVLAVYFILVKFFLPKWMKNRKPFVLKELLMAYNFLQVILNIAFVYKCTKPFGFRLPLTWFHLCELGEIVGYTQSNEKEFLVGIANYHMLKLLDLLDTVFFVLRKKNSQITFLHVFHHTTMLLNSWLSLAIFKEYVISIFGILNSFVHILVYSYYFLAAFGPKIQKYLWWKKHITRIQLVQFVMVLCVLAKVKVDGCNTTPYFWSLWFFNISSYFILFLHFYVTTYRKHDSKVE